MQKHLSEQNGFGPVGKSSYTNLATMSQQAQIVFIVFPHSYRIQHATIGRRIHIEQELHRTFKIPPYLVCRKYAHMGQTYNHHAFHTCVVHEPKHTDSR